MSTRSYICMEQQDGSVKGIYCHWDGYLEYNGAILAEHYKEREKVEKLLSLGSLSRLAEKIDPDPSRPHTFDYKQRQDDVCLFFTRDRGDEFWGAKEIRLQELNHDIFIEFIYVLSKEGKWKYFQSGRLKKGLRDLESDL